MPPTRQLRIVIVTQTDPFYLPLFFTAFCRLLDEHNEDIHLSGVVIQKPLGNNTLTGLAKRVIGLYGMWGTILKTSELISNTLADRLYRFFPSVAPRSTKHILSNRGYEILECENVNQESFIRFLGDNQIDLLVSVSASQIFSEALLSVPRLGCINLHNGALPQYKGMLPNFWQMYNGESHTTLTIHKTAPQLDAGDILLTRKTRIPPARPLDDVIKLTKRKSALALMDLLVSVANGTGALHGTAPPSEGAVYYTFPTRADVKEFKRRGHRVL